MSEAIFWIVAIVIVGSALAMVISRNIVHSALYLVVSFIGVAAVYLLLEADFLAMVQIMIYAGAVSVLLVFGVMLTRRGDICESNLFNRYRLIGGVVAAFLFILVSRLVLNNVWPAAGEPVADTVTAIADSMLMDFVVPFEVAALLLLAAMIGAIMMARGAKQNQ
ncbi:MAG: NADH-quinone oxidoreductase subunit J family protein [Bacillota bacterium]